MTIFHPHQNVVIAGEEMRILRLRTSSKKLRYRLIPVVTLGLGLLRFMQRTAMLSCNFNQARGLIGFIPGIYTLDNDVRNSVC